MAEPEKIDLDHLARLARIAMSSEEKAQYRGQLEEVLSYFDKLQEVDVDGVEPSAHPFDVENVWHDDVAGETLSPEDLNRNVPASRINQVLVPKVVEDA